MKNLTVYSSFLVIFLMCHNASGINSTNSSVCKKALTHISQPLLNTARMVEVQKLGLEINNLKSCEYPLCVSEINSGLIYFTELKKGNNINREYFFSKYDSTTLTWETPINIEKEYSKFCEINKIMNFDEIFITINYDIYRVDLKSSTFSPQKLNINTKYIETSPMLSADGSTLYFVSDRPGGYGGKDIWSSERLSNNRWSEPINLGKTINTSDNEESPFLMSDGATLYFSSKGHNSYGGYDIFTSTQNDEGSWSTPENLGTAVNSTSDDYYYITDSYGNMAYYSTDKIDKDKQDIFIVKYEPLNNNKIL
jgi:hypothetical protein